MRSLPYVSALCLLAPAPLFASTKAQAPCTAAFPMSVVADQRTDGAGLVLQLREAESKLLGASERVRMEAVPLSDGRTVDLDLRRVTLDDSDLVVMVDGVPARQDDGGSVMWIGSVAGDADSDVFLAFSRHGSRGWIRTADETFHVLAAPGTQGGWAHSESRMMSESSLLARGMKPSAFEGDELVPPGRTFTPPSSTGASQSVLGGTTLVCRMALETDFQLYQIFNDLTAEQAYVTQLFAAANARYVQQINTALQRVYVAYYTTAADPWTSPEIGNSVDMLFEFQAAWQFNIPNAANLAHFVSGAGLGGGVAFLDVLCDAQYGFAVSGNVGGDNPFPVVQGPLNWDFIVFTHETGHNFGTPHTHDFCPPLDQCAPSSYFGQCQTQQVCINNGTLMGYCHLCPGGISNVYPYFHPQCVDLMRQRAEASCMGPWCTGATTYCPATVNSSGLAGAMSASGSSSVAANRFTVTASNLPPNTPVLFFYGNQQVQVAQAQGFRCVGSRLFRLPPVLDSGALGSVSRLVNFGALPAGSGPGKIDGGTLWNFTVYYRDPSMGNGGYNFTDALSMPFCP